ncbi:MAG: 4Fe-4S dicluster domain-containing protein [Deltaproteobacteria bacterium]|nr:MAG: 4Fe-4S dicluster domain-containing protein [Deltaproteobacteria bacterium]
MPQYGFLFDQSRCIGCNACLLACKQWHDIAPGPIKWMRVYQWEKGVFPNVRLHHLAIPCYHCESPVCMKACPNGAIHKERKYGAVLVDIPKCKGTRKCWAACPYGAPQFEGDEPDMKMSKCNMCIDRLETGLKPICVLSCPMRALEFGPIDELKRRYGNLRRLEDMPKDSITDPAVVFIPSEPKRQVIHWDADKALKLWQKRQSHQGGCLPDVFAKTSDVTEVPENIIGRNYLVLKAKNMKELMYYTTDDE